MKTGLVINLIFLYYTSLHNWSFTQWPPTQSCLQTILLRGGQRELKSSKRQLCISPEYWCNLPRINLCSKLVSPWVLAKQGFGKGFSREQQKAPCRHWTENAVSSWFLVRKCGWEGRSYPRHSGARLPKAGRTKGRMAGPHPGCAGRASDARRGQSWGRCGWAAGARPEGWRAEGSTHTDARCLSSCVRLGRAEPSRAVPDGAMPSRAMPCWARGRSVPGSGGADPCRGRAVPGPCCAGGRTAPGAARVATPRGSGSAPHPARLRAAPDPPRGARPMGVGAHLHICILAGT